MDSMNMFSLEGKTVVVTGGSSHLGAAISEAVCRFGANAVICSRNVERNRELAERLSRENGVRAKGMHLDFTVDDSVAELVKAIIRDYKRIDVLFNNAAFSKAGLVEEQPYEDFMLGLHGTIGGAFNVTRHVLGPMIEQRSGNIINISSMFGAVSPNPEMYSGSDYKPGPSSYGAGKAAVIQFTRYIACNYAKYNIRANCIVPGAFPKQAIRFDTAFMEKIKQEIPLGRAGDPDDLKGIAVFLASGASSYVTGQSIHVDGGWTAW
jgi:gluconate 5-dehydrogenase